MRKISFVLMFILILSVGTCLALGIDNTLDSLSGEKSGEIFSGELGSGEISGDDIYSDDIYDVLNDILNNNTEDNTVLEDVGDNNIMKFGDIISIKGVAKDLLILAGRTVNDQASGSYGFVAGQYVNISGDIDKDAFLVGNNVKINGNIGRDAYILGTNITINGNIGRNSYLCGSEVIINSSAVLEGDITLFTDKLTIENGATINGTVTYDNSTTVQIPGYVKTNIINTANITEENNSKTFVITIENIVVWLLANIILFAITMLIAPRLFEKIKLSYEKKGIGTLFASLGFGILILIVVPIIAIFAMITIIGLSLGVAAIFAYILLILYSTVLTGYFIGVMLFKKTNLNKYLVGIIGIIIVQILRCLPIIGGWISFFTVLISLGLIVEVARKLDKEE